MVALRCQGLSIICTTLCGWIKGKGQGYKCDVFLKGGIQMICTLGNDATVYIGTTKPLLIVGLNLLIILSLYI